MLHMRYIFLFLLRMTHSHVKGNEEPMDFVIVDGGIYGYLIAL